jgi:hypothetical protein
MTCCKCGKSIDEQDFICSELSGDGVPGLVHCNSVSRTNSRFVAELPDSAKTAVFKGHLMLARSDRPAVVVHTEDDIIGFCDKTGE